ncbi:CrcB-like protein-domain-containing protein [Absidia repens]|uniref:CrcB-like protein-domain-containing protein n=1 Tax=Absidia repens TaxID=90262 RepID=A0A1X2IAQ1_9FUNG|nr:CrcB-like protein-domain-containing protein [Absidia repens]
MMNTEARANSALQQANQEFSNALRRNSDLLRHPPTITVYEKKFVITFIIIPFAIAGALIRVALQRLETFPGAPVFSLVYAQWIGCFIMGIVTLHKNNIFFLYHPLQVALSTGLCGSITTFSSWQLGIFDEFANINAADHTRGKNVLAALSQLVVTLAMSFSGYHCGHHVGRWLDHMGLFHPVLRRLVGGQTSNNGDDKNSGGSNNGIGEINGNIIEQSPPVPQLWHCGFSISCMSWVDRIIVVFGILSWIGVIIAAVLAPADQRELALTCVFAPVGALLRWYLSFFNGIRSDIFVGTFAANMLGTLVLAVISLLRSGVTMSSVSCSVLGALADGFCGCLTTISTFVVELSVLPLRQSYIYALTSVVLGQCFMFIIVGPFIWTRGFNGTC